MVSFLDNVGLPRHEVEASDHLAYGDVHRLVVVLFVHWGRGWRKKERPYFVRFCIIARYAGLTEETNGGQKRGEMEEHLCHFVSDRHPDRFACSFAFLAPSAAVAGLAHHGGSTQLPSPLPHDVIW